MSKLLPDGVSPWALAQSGRRLQGQVALTRLSRLAQEFSIRKGWVWAELAFDCEGPGRCFVTGRIQAQLPLTCQRCLQPLAWSLDIHPRLGLVVAESEMDRWPDNYDPWVVKPEEQASLWRLVEDELFLSLPIVTRHPWGACRPLALALEGVEEQAETVSADRSNPFAVLRKVKIKTKNSS